MAHPKRRHSTTRRDKRRTHDKITAPAIHIDPETGDESLRHRVNLETGMYRGRKVMPGRNDY
ncbi:MAG: 50S ribosomal protein L32 [Catalinimonas sp.]